ncbi:MAG TPA: cytochrome c3 family protein [Kiritimatiellia bacterium]|jgi:hypothetical protein
MAQVFSPRANTVARVSILLVLLAITGLLVTLDALHRFAYASEVDIPREQPIPFSHKHHVNMGIDCRYCHTSAEESPFAGIPPTKTCMNCHAMVWSEAPMLEPVRESFRSGEPLQWNRVHDLPQFVYFDHSIHLSKGIGCTTCHGKVGEMPLVKKENSLYMGWCLDCHREPEKFVRPREEVFNPDYRAPPPAEQLVMGEKLVKEYKIDKDNHRMLNCALCHR